MNKKLILVVLGLSLLGMGLSASGRTAATPAATGSTMNIVVGPEPNSIDPGLNNAVDAFIYISHAYEGLYRFADNGSGEGKLAPGQAESYTKTVNADGTVTYVFKLRPNLKWSDGKSLVAQEFVYSWSRVVDSSNGSPYDYFFDMVVNAAEITLGKKNKSELGMRAIDDRTLEIILTYDCPYFMDVVAASLTGSPLRADLVEGKDQWTFSPSTYIGNGPYRMKEWVHNSYILLEKNPYYYAPVPGPETLKFMLMDNDNAILAGFRNGEIDFIESFPVDEVPGLIASGEMHIVNYLGTYYISLNASKAPFDNALVRKAFSLAIDRNFIVNQITRSGEKAADGFVPGGVSDAAGAGSDFRKTRGGYYSTRPEDYEKNVAEAKRLLAEAGYPNGRNFPVVEYIYNTSDAHRAIGEALQDMWHTQLGVNITLSNQDWAVFLDTRDNGDYLIARNGWIGNSDPISFLDLFISSSPNNDSQYHNPRYDAIIAQARSTSVPAERMRFMHQAEDLFIGEDSVVAPVYFYTNKYMMNPALTGMYYTPTGLFYFDHVRPVSP
ncbi:MAG: peptide ABC transporter substrate-binding protein [Treponema sp.]|nr:peptide ABC transporter substrate-binding protein [Treponema sp.]